MHLKCVVSPGLEVHDGHGVEELLLLQAEALHGDPHQLRVQAARLAGRAELVAPGPGGGAQLGADVQGGGEAGLPLLLLPRAPEPPRDGVRLLRLADDVPLEPPEVGGEGEGGRPGDPHLGVIFTLAREALGGAGPGVQPPPDQYVS